MKQLIIMRGLPGSGKSQMARNIPRAVIHATDNFFMEGKNRDMYIFDSTRIAVAHRFNQEQVALSLTDGVNTVVVDNTNVHRWEMRPYVKMGVELGYVVRFLMPDWSPSLYLLDGGWNTEFLRGRNVHGVPHEVVERMAANFEWDPRLTWGHPENDEAIQAILESKAPWEIQAA